MIEYECLVDSYKNTLLIKKNKLSNSKPKPKSNLKGKNTVASEFEGASSSIGEVSIRVRNCLI